MSGFVERRGNLSNGKPRWLARHRGPDKRERSKSFTRKRDAELWLAEQEAAIARGGWVPSERGRRLIRDVADEWLEVHQGKPSTIANYHSVLAKHILPRFGEVGVGAIDRSSINRFVAELHRSGLAPITTRNILNSLKGLLSYAVDIGAIATSPADGVSAPRPRPSEMTIASETQVAELANAVGAAS